MMRKVALSIPVLLLFTIVLALFSVGTKARSPNKKTFSVMGIKLGMSKADAVTVLEPFLKYMKGGCKDLESAHDGNLRQMCSGDGDGFHLDFVLLNDKVVVVCLETLNRPYQSTVSHSVKDYGEPSEQTETTADWRRPHQSLKVQKRGEEIVVLLAEI